MNEKGKDQFLIDAQKEFGDFWNEQIGIDEEMRNKFRLFIESKLKKARIEELEFNLCDAKKRGTDLRLTIKSRLNFLKEK